MTHVKEIKSTESGIDHLHKTLREKKTVETIARLWGISHNSGEREFSLKLGRYKKPFGELENYDPKSELTLDPEEFSELIKFLENNYEPFSKGIKKYINLEDDSAKNILKIFKSNSKKNMIEILANEKIMSNDLYLGLENAKRVSAIKEFEQMLEEKPLEEKWQKWFERNQWVLGSHCVKILDERKIDTKNITDYLIEAYDGFLDIIEIKRTSEDFPVWSKKLDHDNYIPSQEIIKAITQSVQYIFEVERESNSVKFLERVDGVKVIKPRCVLIYGRSHEWNEKQKEAFRILNSSYHNISILTYDQVLIRAKKMLGIEDIKINNNDK